MSECFHEDCGYGICYEEKRIHDSYAEGERVATKRIAERIEAADICIHGEPCGTDPDDPWCGPCTTRAKLLVAIREGASE